ncbi:hypothetical protein PLESTB_001767600 [Pleodorina starrii]|uniref:Uncharacterized protein n=1 Tax=Pleodorina starrii TaxID=330485 RepID=A0A9W6C167_9CHLO|nr:hypothetical protein PLESTB_001767600 [Pleodorina starrii]
MAECETSGEISNHGVNPSGPEVPPNVFAALSTMFEWAHRIGRPLERSDLNALRLTCRDGRDLVDQHDLELHLRLSAPTSEQRERLDGRLPEVLGGWAARLKRRQRCTCLRVEISFRTIGKWGLPTQQQWRPADLCDRLLSFVDAAPGTTENIRELHIRLLTNSDDDVVELPTTLPERLAARFPSLQDLRLMGACTPADPWFFCSGIAAHLPRLQRLQICFIEGLYYIGELVGSLTQLRDLTLSFTEHAHEVSMSQGEAEVLARFPNLRTLRLQGVPATNPSVRHVLRYGLGEALEELEIEGGGVRLTRARMSGDCSSSSGQPQQQQQQIGSWDMDVSDHHLLKTVVAAVTASGLPLNKLRVQKAEPGFILSRSMVRYLNILKVDAIRLSTDREVPKLGRALQQLTESPKCLIVYQVQHRHRMASLGFTCAPLLAPSLQRLEFHSCAGLTPAHLVSLLVALPLCEEVVVRSCEGVNTGREYMALVELLLALPQGAELRSRPLHIHLDGIYLRHRRPLEPLESDEGTEYVDAEARNEKLEVCHAPHLIWMFSPQVPSVWSVQGDDEGPEVDNDSLLSWITSLGPLSVPGTSEDDEGEEEEGEEEGEGEGGEGEEVNGEEEVEEEDDDDEAREGEEEEEEGEGEGGDGEEEEEGEVEEVDGEGKEEEQKQEADEVPRRQQAVDAEDIVRRLTDALMEQVSAWELNRLLEDGGVAARVSIGTL